MATVSGSLRRLVLAPSLASVGFSGRGFAIEMNEATRRMEAVPQSVVCGFEWGIETRGLDELERRLELIEPDLRGFAYEGAAMALTVLDATAGGTRTRDLLSGRGSRHLLLAYIGVGFAMARLPRMLWRKVLPDLEASIFHPTMCWLAVDGYGFDLAYFGKRRWIDRQEVPKPYPWQGAPEYFLRAVDQGIGRALWFVHGGRPANVSPAVGAFAAHRRADLWAGVGLAAAFAGGCATDELAALALAAGEYRADLSVGCVFAVRARALAGHTPPHTEAAARALTGAGLDELVEIADTTAVGEGTADEPAYERWRQRIKQRTHAIEPAV
ncbi:DUF1702 family protein [Amycolatopsis sp. QT-25]|uniref:DUF1702 family protein n=1 Tax=Amycolatopsis sp. QT-25 TaxID=3034022 RepID=UPI0023EC9CC5|nr:DUF1702 family protein [Amycolatopsis sp. QT-25]WET83228.1 DUF1702 family protein [Amycolatopsis sp. QT-25]